MLVKHVMTERPSWIKPDVTMKSAAKRMKTDNIGVLPICTKGKLIGLITDRDIVIRGLAEDGEIADKPVKNYMSTFPIWCAENEDVEDAIRLMEKHQLHRLPVIDGEQKLKGILSLSDASHHISHELSGEAIDIITKDRQALASTNL